MVYLPSKHEEIKYLTQCNASALKNTLSINIYEVPNLLPWRKISIPFVTKMTLR